MTAYAAASVLKNFTATLKEYYDVSFPAPLMEIVEVVDKEMMLFIVFVERLDSRSRKRMSATLEQSAIVISKYTDEFISHLKSLRESLSKPLIDVEGDRFSIVLEDLKQVTETLIATLKKTKEEEYCYSYPKDEGATESSSAGNCYKHSKMVGLRDVYKELKEAIYGNDVVSLIGMIGIGKTTLAREIFQDLDIVEMCVYRAWVTVGKEFKYGEIIESILAQVDPQVHDIAKGGNERMMVEYLQESLASKQTLIVLNNDLWNEDALHCFLKDTFATIGLVKVLLTATKGISGKYVYMRLLNEEESWDLLRVKVFGDKKPCPPQLEKAGREIAEKCDGLPLTIVTVANLLSEAGKTKESLWIEVATRKRHQVFTKAYDEISKVLYPSYENIHRKYYRLCFLYMGVFPIKYKMRRSQINNLWNVEKLLPQFHEESAIGVRVLQHLAEYNLLMVLQRSTSLTPYKENRRVKSCRLHSSWWHFCQREAAKTNFVHIVECPEDCFGEGIRGQSRLSFHNNVLFALKDVYNSVEGNCASTAHSLLCFGPYHQYQVPICFGLKLLQRLDALNIRFYKFPLEVLKLVKLIYLALTCNAKLPSSISKLVELQFLIVNQCVSIRSQRGVTYLPTQIWYMKKLEHLQIMGNDLPDRGSNFMLRNLKTLLDVSAESCTTDVLRRTPNLTKLGIRIELRNDDDDDETSMLRFGYISHLDKLESFKCVVVNPISKFEVVDQYYLWPIPSNLKKLNLSGLGYSWEKMSRIALLPNLEVLKLRCNAFEGPKWEIKEHEFPKVYFLLIEDIDLVQLTGEQGSFKCLQDLHIKHCYKLEKLRLGSRRLPNIDIVDSNPSAYKEVKRIIVEHRFLPQHVHEHSSWKS